MDQTEVRDAALEVLSHLEEIAGKGQTEFACSSFPSMKLIPDYANAMLSTEPLSLDVLRRELGEPDKFPEEWDEDCCVAVWFRACGIAYAQLDHDGAVYFGGMYVHTLGAMRRILTVICESAAGGEGE